MKAGDIFKFIGKAIVDALLKIDFKPIIYSTWKDTFRPKVEARVLGSEEKWDDALLVAFDKVMDVLFGPNA